MMFENYLTRRLTNRFEHRAFAGRTLIQSWLGHAHYSTTADIYTHLRADAKRKVGDVLSGELRQHAG